MGLDTRRHWPIALGRSARAGFGPRLVSVVLSSAAMTLFGCSPPPGSWFPEVILDTQMGTIPPYPQALVAQGPQAARSTGQAAESPGGAVSLDGRYVGNAVPLTTNGGMCVRPLAVNFVVRGGSVQFDRFHGTIGPGDSLQMAYDGDWIIGQFQGPTFRGHWSVPGPYRELGCTYFISLAWHGS